MSLYKHSMHFPNQDVPLSDQAIPKLNSQCGYLSRTTSSFTIDLSAVLQEARGSSVEKIAWAFYGVLAPNNYSAESYFGIVILKGRK